MECRILALFVALLPAAVAAGAEASAEIAVTTTTKLELVSNGRPGGSVGLRAGEKLQLVEVDGDSAVVRYRTLSGRVPLAHTDAVNRVVTPLEPAAPAAKPAAAAMEPKAPAAPYLPAGAIERALAGKLVALENGAVRPHAPARLAGARFFGVYFSASWCGPCRAFTPQLVDAYGKIRALYPEFEVVLVSSDNSAADMVAYMREDRMPWPALAWAATKSAREITRYAGSGIPCLVLVNAEGKVLADSFRRGSYVGPDSVLDETWKVLREYRKKNPRPKG